MSTRDQSTAGRLSWLRGWGWPISWIGFAPLVTITLQMAWLENLIRGGECNLAGQCDTWLGGGTYASCWECSMRDVFPTLLPGLLNLGAFLWLLSSSTVTRRVAFVAGVLGAVRIAVPALLYALAGSNVTIYRWPDEITYVRGDSFALNPGLWSFGLWWLTVVACIFFAEGIAKRNKAASGREPSST